MERCIRAGMTRCPRAAAVMQHVLWHELLLLLLLFFPQRRTARIPPVDPVSQSETATSLEIFQLQ